MVPFKAAVFDLDGTLLDTLDDLCDACNYALSSFDYPTRSKTEVCSFVGNGIKLLMHRAMPRDLDDHSEEELLNCFKNYYSMHNQVKTKPYPGICEMLSSLKAAGLKIGIVSNKNDPNVKALAKAYFPDTIDIAIGEMPGIQKKPAPDSVLYLLSRWNIEPHDTVYIGDSDVDVETARNTECCCAAVSWGFRSRESLTKAGANRIFDTVSALGQFILGGQEQ